MSEIDLKGKRKKAVAIKIVYLIATLAILAGLILPTLSSLGSKPEIMAPGPYPTAPIGIES